MRALITRMDQPLGRAVGNAVEVAESVECLRGHGPGDLMDLSVELAAEMVLMAELAPTLEAAREKCWRTITDGSALARFRKLVAAQGGDPHAIDDPVPIAPAEGRIEVDSKLGGYVHAIEARPIGQATMLLGAGRARVDSKIDPSVGVIFA